MYCRKCGNELPADGKFCPKCGCEVEHLTTKTTDVKVSGKGKKTVLIVTILSLLIVIVSATFVGLHFWNESRYSQLVEDAELYIVNGDIENAISCWEKAIEIRPNDSDEIRGELNYYRSIKDAEIAMNSAVWNQAIEYLEYAIELKPEISNNYLSLATAYVEKWDLYSANKILCDGYERTQSSELKNVSIWGPLSPVEIAYCMTDSIPVTRCEYLFSDNGINSYIYVTGMPIAGAKYYCEDGKVSHITLLDYDDYMDASFLPQHLSGLPLFDTVLTYFDLEYDAENNISAVTYNGQTFVTLEYEGDNCTSITAQMSFRNMFSVGDKLLFSYNDNNLISEIKLGDITVDFDYESNGKTTASVPTLNTIYSFDKDGLWIGLKEDGYDVFSATTENGHITSFKTAGYDVEYAFNYENGKLTLFEVVGAGYYKMFDAIEYFYDEINGVERLVKMKYTLTDHITTNEVILNYDDDGKLVRVFNKFNGYDMELNYMEEKLVSYVMTGVDYTKTTRVINYDNQGHFIGSDYLGE